MTGRRQFGAIRKLPSGRWQARYRDKSDEWRTGPHTFTTKTDAARFLASMETDLARGDWYDPRLGESTVSYWADQWLAGLMVRPNTLRGYEAALRAHVLPAFGPREVASITRADVTAFVAGMVQRGAAPGTAAGARKVLRLVLTQAMLSDAIRKNPCDGVRVPRSRSDEMVFLSLDEVLRLVDAITKPTDEGRQYPEYGLLVRFAALTGLRAGEVAALRVGRVDSIRGRVEVAESVSEVSAARGGLSYNDPKTYERRSVPMPRSLADQVADHLLHRPADRHAFVFTAPDGGPLRHNNFYNRHFKPAVRRAQLPERTRFHDLRHTNASLLVAQGANPLTIKQRLGHSSITVTFDRYGHLFPELEKEMTERLDLALMDAVARHAST